jgi:hypothetical protein
MIAFVVVPVMILIAGPLASVVCMAAYFQEKVIVCIIIIILFNALMLKSPCLKDLLDFSINEPYKKYIQTEGTSKDFDKQEKLDRDTVFVIAILTSWISPCTVWCYNFFSKSKFLLVSCLTNLLGHFMGIAAIFIYILSAEIPISGNPPITHCFTAENYTTQRFLRSILISQTIKKLLRKI